MAKPSTCRLCGADAHEPGGYLRRVNPPGDLPSVWECRPACGVRLTPDAAVLAALTDTEHQHGT